MLLIQIAIGTEIAVPVPAGVTKIWLAGCANGPDYAIIVSMENKDLVRTEEIIEPEILDENGNPIGGEHTPKDSARRKGDNGGIFGGVLVLALGFIMTLLVAAFSLLVVVPLMLIGRVLGFQVRTFKR